MILTIYPLNEKKGLLKEAKLKLTNQPQKAAALPDCRIYLDHHARQFALLAAPKTRLMSVGFGFSVGDFLAAVELVGNVIGALREATGSGANYRDLLKELLTLETALLHVKRLDLDSGQRTEKVALRQAATQCQRTIDDFWNTIQKYQPHLREGGTGSRVKDSWFKIRWAVCKKDDLAKFKADLRGHIVAINVLLVVVQMEAAELQVKEQDESNKTLASRIQECSSQWLGKLSIITDGVNQSVQQGKLLLGEWLRRRYIYVYQSNAVPLF